MRKPVVGVIGGSSCDERIWRLAYEAGRVIARLGYVLVCGGLGGVMEAASKGAADAGGTVIGILPGPTPDDANPYVSYAVATNTGHARNVFIAHTADVLVAIDGKYGTLSEMAVGLTLGKPVYSLESWEIEGSVKIESISELEEVLRKFKEEFEQRWI